MSSRDRSLLLEDMLESALKIQRYTSGIGFVSFMNDEKTLDAVARNFEIIGEAANRIEPDFKMENPEIEWKQIRGFRNRIIHNYFGIDYEIMWTIINNDLDSLINWLKVLIENSKPSN